MSLSLCKAVCTCDHIICGNRVTMRDAGTVTMLNLNNHASGRKEGGPCFVKVVTKKLGLCVTMLVKRALGLCYYVSKKNINNVTFYLF